MKVAFLANSFHLKTTKSSDFFIDLLRRAFDDVHVIPFKEAWSIIPKSKWDLLVVWMDLMEPKELEALGVPRVVLVPMFDNSPHEREFWIRYSRFKILSFSTTFLSELRGWGLDAFGVQYYPAPDSDAPLGSPGLRGFFWPRTAYVGWSVIKTLIGSTKFESLRLHVPVELNPELTDLPTREDEKIFPIAKSSWYKSKTEYGEAVRNANIYFAPRRTEGIGMSFLEAMSWGLCVVAPDAPTMSEYIENGVNGILYDLNNPFPVDFSRYRDLGTAARESCLLGRVKWESSFGSIKTFLETRPSGSSPWKSTQPTAVPCGLRWIQPNRSSAP